MKRALLVGIDHYPTADDLGGCVADAAALADLLATHADGSPNFSVEMLTSTSAQVTITRETLRDALAQLFLNSRDTDLLFFFAGHGGSSPWGTEYERVALALRGSDKTVAVKLMDIKER